MVKQSKQLTEENIDIAIEILKLFTLGLGPSHKDLSEALDSAIVGLCELQERRRTKSNPVGFFIELDGLFLQVKGDEVGGGSATPLYTAPQPVSVLEKVRREHTERLQATSDSVDLIGTLKCLSNKILEVAVAPSDIFEWADMQFLLWDAQRKVGISDELISMAMSEKLAKNKVLEWSALKCGGSGGHIKEKTVSDCPDCKYCGGTGYFRWQQSANTFPCPCMGCVLPET